MGSRLSKYDGMRCTSRWERISLTTTTSLVIGHSTEFASIVRSYVRAAEGPSDGLAFVAVAGVIVDAIRWGSIVLSFPNSFILVIIHAIV